MRKLALVPILLLLALAAPASAAGRPATPELIDAADRSGRISDETADLYRAYAIGDHEKLPAAYRSDTPWDGTLTLLRLRREIARMPRGAARERVEEPIEAQHLGAQCSGMTGTSSIDTTRFHIDYTTVGGGLTINDYGTSLETAWNTEVSSFGWAAPPVLTSNPPPGNRYHVVVTALGPGLYGLVTNSGTHAGSVGDNPDTTGWDEGDALASCMVLNSDFSPFPGSSQQALDATTAHEFNHSIQYGYGAATGSNVPDDIFFEGGATWMEDEVFDGANDNYNYLWPAFEDSMGEYDDSPYPYWITFRGMTERYGTGVTGGGEQVMQDFWELTSKNSHSNLAAMNAALATRGTNLADAFHAYAVAVKFNRACAGGYAYPYCFEEGPAYVTAAGATPLDGSVSSVGGSASASIEDNYSLGWIGLPASGPYDVQVSGVSGGSMRASVACDTGTDIRVEPLPAPVGAGQSGSLASFDPAGCLSAPVAVVTNQAKTADDPSSSASRSFTVSAPPPGTGTNNTGSTGTTGGGGSTGGTTGTTPTTTVFDVVAPAITSMRFSASRFRAARSGASVAIGVGARVAFRVNEAGRVAFTVERAFEGRKVGFRCRKPTRANRGRRACTRWLKVRGSFTRTAKAGINRFRFRGRMGGRRLKLGRYRLLGRARDASGNRSSLRRAYFRIVAR